MGLSAAKNDILVYIDADLQIKPEVLLDVVRAIENNSDIAIGSKHLQESKVEYPIMRKSLTKLYSFLARIILNSKITDFQCGIKGFNRQTITKLLPLVNRKRWSWDTEILFLAEYYGCIIKEIPVVVSEVRKSKVKLWRYINEMISSLITLSLIRRPKHIMLNFDLEEFVIPAEFGYECENEFEISKKGLLRLRKMLKRNNVKSTFFTTLEFAEYCPKMIKGLIKDGHEIALHGAKHTHRYSTMNHAERHIKHAKKALEKMLMVKVNGFRAPKMQALSYKLLKRTGIEYDSSLHPTWVPGYYNNIFAQRGIFHKDGIKVIPVSVMPLLRFPFSWIWFRNLGLNYAKLCTHFYDKGYINIYFHPWEFSDENLRFKNPLAQLCIMNAGNQALKQLEKYIRWAKKNGYMFTSIEDFLQH